MFFMLTIKKSLDGCDLGPSPALPLWRQVEEHLKGLVRSEQLTAGQKLPAHEELSQQLGVGHVTLQRALASLVKQGVIVRQPRRGTFVAEKAHARQLCIGVVTRAMFDPAVSAFDALVARAIASYYGQTGDDYRFYQCLPAPGATDDADADLDPRLIEDVELGRLRGLLVIGRIREEHADFRSQIEAQHLPIVETSIFAPDTAYAVSPDYMQLITLALHHVVEQKRHRPALIFNREKGIADAIDRRPRAWRQALASLGLREADSPMVTDEPTAEGGYACVNRLLDAAVQPDAIICADDVMCRGVIMAFLERNIDVPAKVLLISHANEGRELWSPLPIVRLEASAEAMVRAASEMLAQRIDGRRVAKPRQWIPFRLVLPNDKQ